MITENKLIGGYKDLRLALAQLAEEESRNNQPNDLLYG